MSMEACPRCKGMGMVRDPLYRDPIPCAACEGTGRKDGVSIDRIVAVWYKLSVSQQRELVMTAEAMDERQRAVAS